jgi:hypothetical protein
VDEAVTLADMRTMLLLGVALACGCGKKPAATSATEPADVALATLLSDYKANEARADATYKDKRVRVKGIVGDVKKDFTDAMYVTIQTGTELSLEGVHCQVVDKQVQAASALDKGNLVTVTGTVGGLILTSVILKECEIGPSTKPPPPPVGAAAQKACEAMQKAQIAKNCTRQPSDAGSNVAMYSFLPVAGKHGGLITEYADDATFAKASAKLAASPKFVSCEDAPHRLILLMDPSATTADKIGPCTWLSIGL